MASFKSDGKMIFMIFVGAIITVVFLAAIANSVVPQTEIQTFTNLSITTAAVNSSTTLTGRANTTAITVVNASDGTDWTVNFTANTTDIDGDLGIFLVTTQDAGLAAQNATSANVTYSFEGSGYLQDSSSRSVTVLIVFFGALAIVVFVIVVMFKNSPILEKMRKAR